jgi:hypothetical protein
MIEKATRPIQANCNGMMITQFPASGSFRVGYQEKVIDGDVVLPGKQITLDPYRIASGANPEKFIELLQSLTQAIKALMKTEVNPNED